MSRILTLSSVRGGAGVTSVCAGIADALQQLGKKVLLIDLNPSDMLRLHFNIPYAEKTGWASASAHQQDWKQACYRVTAHLHLVAYGAQGIQAREHDAFPLSELSHLATQFDWIILDCPAPLAPTVQQQMPTSLQLLVVNPDPATQVLLTEQTLGPQQRLLVNGLDPTFSLSNLLLLEWRARFTTHLLPTQLHRDNSIPEALAQKMPITVWRPDSAAARDMHALAIWCLAHAQGATSHA